MNTKILGSPQSPNDGSDANQRIKKEFDLSSRIAEVDWDVDKLQASHGEEELDEDAIETITLYIVSQNLDLMVPLRNVNFVGRSYPQNGYYDGIDFSAYDAYRLGVSRRHMILKRDGKHLYIVDNKSTNGTYLNRAMLKPLQPYFLHYDDQVRLGALELVIKQD